MKNQDMPAMPATVCIKDESNQRYKKDYINVSCCGLTKLEYAAIMICAGGQTIPGWHDRAEIKQLYRELKGKA